MPSLCGRGQPDAVKGEVDTRGGGFQENLQRKKRCEVRKSPVCGNTACRAFKSHRDLVVVWSTRRRQGRGRHAWRRFSREPVKKEIKCVRDFCVEIQHAEHASPCRSRLLLRERRAGRRFPVRGGRRASRLGFLCLLCVRRGGMDRASAQKGQRREKRRKRREGAAVLAGVLDRSRPIVLQTGSAVFPLPTHRASCVNSR